MSPCINLVSLSTDLFVDRLHFLFSNLTNGDAIRPNGQILDTCLHKMQPLFYRLPVPPLPMFRYSAMPQCDISCHSLDGCNMCYMAISNGIPQQVGDYLQVDFKCRAQRYTHADRPYYKFLG